MSASITLNTAKRVANQLRRDRRTLAIVFIIPPILMTLMRYVFNSEQQFDKLALPMLGVFPFVIMFLLTSVAMLRERTSGTLERLLCTPMSKLDILLGYGITFATLAALQAAIACAVSYWFLGLDTAGAASSVVIVAVANAILGMALGLFVSAFAQTEFQAVQFMPAVVLPQLLLCGLFTPRSSMAPWLEKISNVLPLSYAVEALNEVGVHADWTRTLSRNLIVLLGFALAFLVLAAATLRRRTP
ncbi:MAG: ABC transporter permease [Corynebacteriales bacterium]|nr:ABC transporter permease [Mycobacteriales bacterium]